MATQPPQSPLSLLIRKNLSDRTFEKRKLAVDELTDQIKLLNVYY